MVEPQIFPWIVCCTMSLMSTSDKSFYHGFISDLDAEPLKRLENGEVEADGVIYPRLHPKQVPGKYWIDAHVCLFSGNCPIEAPNNIRLEDDEDENFTAYVYRQPETPEEEADMQRAMNCCPVEAVMDTGTENV